MKDQNKTKAQLINELMELRQRIAELESLENEGKRTEEKLQKSEKLLRAFMSAIKESAFVVDTEGIVIISNETLAQRLGTNVNELIGTCIYNYLPPEIARERKTQVDKVIQTGSPSRYEDRRAGMWIDGFLYPIFDEEGRVVNVGVIAVDITERKRAEEEAVQHTKNIEFLSETAMGFVELPAEKDIYRFIGERLRQLIGDAIYVLVNSFDQKTREIRVRALVADDQHMQAVSETLGTDPIVMSFVVSEEAWNGLISGKLVRVPGGIHELSFGEIPKAACDALEKLAGTGDIFVMGFTMKGELYGSATIIMSAGSYLSSRDVVETFMRQAGVALQRKRAEDEIKKLNEELERRVIERTAQLEATNKDMQKEITERKRAEDELKKYQGQLEELVEERTQKIQELERQRTEIEKWATAGLMAARIAHEINNPLAGIKNSFLLVKDAIPQNHPYYEYVGRIDNEINRIARIVRQMFDVYRPEQEIKKEFSVDKTLYEVVALLEAAWRENNITIEIDSKPITMEMPEGLLRQVLYNILVNAIEASPQGGVVKIMTEVDNEILTLSISDQGVGIPLEVQPRLFEPFFTSKDGSRKGLGLGLAVSKDIVEKLGGHIDFESEPGKGTLFRIILPLKSGERR